MSETGSKRIIRKLESNWKICLAVILLLNVLLRLLIYIKTTLFSFSDYKVYIDGVDRIHSEGSIPLVIGNFLFALSYIGYYAKYILGCIDYFFVMNCFLGTLTTFLLAILVIRISQNIFAGLSTALIMTAYTEFMVFSSVFYTPVIMMFLLSFFISLIYFYLKTYKRIVLYFSGILLIILFLTTVFLKQELIFFPGFLLVAGLFFIKRDRDFSLRVVILSFLLFTFSFLLQHSGLITRPEGNVTSNAFIFFGHTDYGGDGGEGSFIYPENQVRYEEELNKYFIANGINNPTAVDYNSFQWDEIRKFITQHPFKWVGLQFTKFFRTFGVVPETTSFKVLYTGLLNGNLRLTAMVVVAPVAMIILLFILLFNYQAIKQLFKNSSGLRAQGSGNSVPSALRPVPYSSHPAFSPHHLQNNKHFLYIYCLLFFYYLIATIFFGQYQERYRMPLMVVFIIPMLGYFIATFNKKQFFNRISLIIKGGVIILFLTVWVFQAKKAISNKDRLENAIESVRETIDHDKDDPLFPAYQR
jgi:hypothetical protein